MLIHHWAGLFMVFDAGPCVDCLLVGIIAAVILLSFILVCEGAVTLQFRGEKREEMVVK